MTASHDEMTHGLGRAPTTAELAGHVGRSEEAALEALQAVVDSEALHVLLARLRDVRRRVLLRRFVGNMTQSEIACRVGDSEMEVSRLLRSGLERLRRQLRDESPAAVPERSAPLHAEVVEWHGAHAAAAGGDGGRR